MAAAPSTSLSEAPERPIGAKLEITYACNLRCGFCYTDSPRRTLQRTPELSDEEWHEVVRQSLELGIVEAVVTGGEPFLRKELTLGVVETLAGAGVGVTLNTNGWFVDEEVAERLGALRGVTAHVSLDGARAGLHDGSRGVPGSWRRAVEGIDRLLGAGVGVCVVHVVTPANAAAVPDFLEQMWALGVPWMRVTPVVVTGAAARGGDWQISRKALQDAVDEFRRRHGTAMQISPAARDRRQRQPAGARGAGQLPGPPQRRRAARLDAPVQLRQRGAGRGRGVLGGDPGWLGRRADQSLGGSDEGTGGSAEVGSGGVSG